MVSLPTITVSLTHFLRVMETPWVCLKPGEPPTWPRRPFDLPLKTKQHRASHLRQLPHLPLRDLEIKGDHLLGSLKIDQTSRKLKVKRSIRFGQGRNFLGRGAVGDDLTPRGVLLDPVEDRLQELVPQQIHAQCSTSAAGKGCLLFGC